MLRVTYNNCRDAITFYCELEVDASEIKKPLTYEQFIDIVELIMDDTTYYNGLREMYDYNFYEQF